MSKSVLGRPTDWPLAEWKTFTLLFSRTLSNNVITLQLCRMGAHYAFIPFSMTMTTVTAASDSCEKSKLYTLVKEGEKEEEERNPV